MGIWETVKGWIGNDIFSIFVYVAILLLFGVGIAKCILPVVRTRDLLKRAVKNIKKGDKARRSWQEDRFLGRGVLMPHWSEYLNNLFFADNEYHNPANVEDYINEETVIDGPGSARLADALPGVMVSLGFLGTLLGLSFALSGMGADVSDVSGSMSTLLGSMRYAFLTSIVGVIASVLFTLLTRAVHGSAERTLLEFYNAMARYAGVLSVDPMTQIAIYQQEQTGLMKQLLENVNPERFGEKLNETLAPLAESVKDTMRMTSKMQKEMMDEVAQAYIRRMDEAVHGQFDHLAATLEETCRYQEKTIKGVGDALSSFGDAARAMRDIRDKSADILEKYEAVLNRISQAQARNEDNADKVDAIVFKQGDYMRMLSSLNDDFSRQSDAIARSTEEFLSGVNRLSETNADALQKFEQAGENLTQSMTDARKKMSRDMNESLTFFEDCMSEIIKRVDWATKAAKEAVEGLPDAVKASSEQYLNEIDALSGALRTARKRLQKSGGGDE